MLYFSYEHKTYIVTELGRFDLLQYLRLKGTIFGLLIVHVIKSFNLKLLVLGDDDLKSYI